MNSLSIPLRKKASDEIEHFKIFMQNIFVEKEMIKILFLFYSEPQFFEFYKFLMSQKTFTNIPKEYQWLTEQPLIEHNHFQQVKCQYYDSSGHCKMLRMCCSFTKINTFEFEVIECEINEIQQFGWIKFIKKNITFDNQDIKQKEMLIIAFLHVLKKIFKE